MLMIWMIGDLNLDKPKKQQWSFAGPVRAGSVFLGNGLALTSAIAVWNGAGHGLWAWCDGRWGESSSCLCLCLKVILWGLVRVGRAVLGPEKVPWLLCLALLCVQSIPWERPVPTEEAPLAVHGDFHPSLSLPSALIWAELGPKSPCWGGAAWFFVLFSF